ncbi:DgyrCDS2894 [Dimorphilus gyrociliatus]|uniref:Transporter n=1 Tax=Dimorphilus gyrociliatus TaxID=2664684 RepID=A0A7I8VGQ0_9ANNE|nr:DgyrCDS2894 [Dimorphilus gyrociliatus]
MLLNYCVLLQLLLAINLSSAIDISGYTKYPRQDYYGYDMGRIITNTQAIDCAKFYEFPGYIKYTDTDFSGSFQAEKTDNKAQCYEICSSRLVECRGFVYYEGKCFLKTTGHWSKNQLISKPGADLYIKDLDDEIAVDGFIRFSEKNYIGSDFKTFYDTTRHKSEQPKDMSSKSVEHVEENNKFLPGRVQVFEERIGERIKWGNKLDFMFTCIGYAVGFGNIWRFPYICYQYGGGAFLVPYFILIAVMGLPCYFLLFVFGQFSKLGLLQMWRISPICKGIGYAIFWINFVIGCGYSILASQVAVYFFASVVSIFHGIPWNGCNNTWNTENCTEIGNTKNFTTHQALSLSNNSVTAVQEYYNNYILEKSSGLEDFSGLSWKLSLGLLFRYMLSFILLIKGIRSLGKAAYFFSIFPYFMLFALLIRSCTLPGFLDGIFYLLKPDFSKLLNIRVWYIAASQVIFSMGAVDPTNIVMASYNDFHHNCLKDALVITVINSLTSLLAGFVVFSTLGFIAHERQTLVEDVATNGPGLVFEVYPEAISRMPLPALWAVLFFSMMLTLGISSMLPSLEALSSSITDLWPTFYPFYHFQWQQVQEFIY